MFPPLSLQLALCLVSVGSVVTAGPCDLYAAGKTPCVAAHSTTRALFNAFSGALYQVQRGSDSTTTNISPISAGGVANAATQDSFCTNTTCLITIIYDQSGRGNHLTQAPERDSSGKDNLASAIGAPVTLNGQKAYGVFIPPGTGYRNDATSGIATGDEPEGLYEVVDGTHFNDECCYDYGNAETTNTDNGNGHMESIYFGNHTSWGVSSGGGPWILADLENGLYTGATANTTVAGTPISSRFVTAIVKGEPNQWAIRGGNAAAGPLMTRFSGPRPDLPGYNPMHKEGAIILGIGGDNSDGGQGTFYEGVLTSGYPSDATEDAVQANIVAAKYAAGALTSGPTVPVGSAISFRATTPGSTTQYLAHNGSDVVTEVISSSSSSALQGQALWTVETGLGNSGCVSFQSKDTPGSYIRQLNFVLQLNADDGTKQFAEDATFCPQTPLNGQGNAFRSWNNPTRFFRHFNDGGYIASQGGPETFDSTTSFSDDVSWVAGSGFD